MVFWHAHIAQRDFSSCLRNCRLFKPRNVETISSEKNNGRMNASHKDHCIAFFTAPEDLFELDDHLSLDD